MSSLVVSYTRARAEALGVQCKVGIADRLVRVIIISAGLVLRDLGALEPAVYVLAALTTFTVVQRILHVRRAFTAAGAPVTQHPSRGVRPGERFDEKETNLT